MLKFTQESRLSTARTSANNIKILSFENSLWDDILILNVHIFCGFTRHQKSYCENKQILHSQFFLYSSSLKPTVGFVSSKAIGRLMSLPFEASSSIASASSSESTFSLSPMSR